MSKYAVIVSQRADEMLVKHARFLAQVRVSAAERMVEEFEKVLDILEENPYQFPVEEKYDLPAGYRKALFSKWYKAVYLVDDNKRKVYLDAILDCRQENSLYF